jgi:hypothetical protein
MAGPVSSAAILSALARIRLGIHLTATNHSLTFTLLHAENSEVLSFSIVNMIDQIELFLLIRTLYGMEHLATVWRLLVNLD